MEALSSRVDAGTLVVEVRLSLNLMALTLEQVIGKRKKVLSDLEDSLKLEVQATLDKSTVFARASADLLRVLLRRGPLSAQATDYNDDTTFAKAVEASLKLRQQIAAPTEEYERVRMLVQVLSPSELAAHAPELVRSIGVTAHAGALLKQGVGNADLQHHAVKALHQFEPAALVACSEALLPRLRVAPPHVRSMLASLLREVLPNAAELPLLVQEHGRPANMHVALAKKAVVFGSLNIDMMFKSVDALDSRALSAVGNSSARMKFSVAFGGKGGNQAAGIHTLGVPVSFVGRVGADAFGDNYVQRLRDDGLVVDGIFRDPAVVTGIATQLQGLSQDGKSFRYHMHDLGANDQIMEDGEEVRFTRAQISRGDVRVLALTLETPLRPTVQVAGIAQEHGALVALKCSPLNEKTLNHAVEMLSSCTHVFLNEVELALLCGWKRDVSVTFERAKLGAQLLAGKYPTLTTVVIICVERFGALCHQTGADSSTLLIPFEQLKGELHFIGVADAFYSYFLAALAHNLPTEHALSWAFAAAQVKLTLEGAQSLPREHQVLDYLERNLRLPPAREAPSGLPPREQLRSGRLPPPSLRASTYMLLNALHYETIRQSPPSLLKVLADTPLEQLAQWLCEESALGRTPIQMAHKSLMAAREAQLRHKPADPSRHLLQRVDDKEVKAPAIGSGRFHLFLSHVWGGGGQDLMRLIKAELLQMVKGLVIFLDVDDLDLATVNGVVTYLAKTETVLVYVQMGYFCSKNCMRELLYAVSTGMPIIALVDPADHDCEATRQWIEAAAMKLEEWGLPDEMRQHGLNTLPSADQLFEALYASEAIEKNTIGWAQSVTMSLLAERLLPEGLRGATYLPNQLTEMRPTLPPPTGRPYHVYCSIHNPGAAELVAEVSAALSLNVKMTSNPDELPRCASCLVYLNRYTWTRKEASTAFAAEVTRANEHGVHLLLAHETPGVGGQEKRHACPFNVFFNKEDGTPESLLKAGIYKEIATMLKGGPWRKGSMVLMAMALGGMEPDEAAARVHASEEELHLLLATRLILAARGLMPPLAPDGSKWRAHSFKVWGANHWQARKTEAAILATAGAHGGLFDMSRRHSSCALAAQAAAAVLAIGLTDTDEASPAMPLVLRLCEGRPAHELRTELRTVCRDLGESLRPHEVVCRQSLLSALSEWS